MKTPSNSCSKHSTSIPQAMLGGCPMPCLLCARRCLCGLRLRTSVYGLRTSICGFRFPIFAFVCKAICRSLTY
jgi:hypothetical protein